MAPLLGCLDTPTSLAPTVTPLGAEWDTTRREKQKSERTCPSDASPLSSFKCNDIAIQDETSIFETMLLLLLQVLLNFDSVKHRRNTDAQVQVLAC